MNQIYTYQLITNWQNPAVVAVITPEFGKGFDRDRVRGIEV
jgi:hypothetical protein